MLRTEQFEENNRKLVSDIAYAKEQKETLMALRDQLEMDVIISLGNSKYIASPLNRLSYCDEKQNEIFGLEVKGSITGWNDRSFEHSVGRKTFILSDMNLSGIHLVLPPRDNVKQPSIEGFINNKWHTIVDSKQPDTLHQTIKYFKQLRETSITHNRMNPYGRIITRTLSRR